MISAGYCRLMSRYNTWQNTSLVTAADGLTDEDRWKDRGAFFQSIAATFNHLYWADALILERLKGNERAEETIKHSLTSPSDWQDFKTLRSQKLKTLCAIQLFNHQTHHRGQIHAMLTAAGTEPDPTDVQMLT